MRTILMWFLVGLAPLAAEQLPLGAANAETGLVTFPGCRLINAEGADGRGHSLHKRYYEFITGGKGGLGRVLARAFGVGRSRKAGVSRDEYKEQLKDEAVTGNW